MFDPGSTNRDCAVTRHVRDARQLDMDFTGPDVFACGADARLVPGANQPGGAASGRTRRLRSKPATRAGAWFFSSVEGVSEASPIPATSCVRLPPERIGKSWRIQTRSFS